MEGGIYMIIDKKNIKNPYLLAYLKVFNIKDGEEIKRTTYKGTERKQALIDFESLKTEYKSAIFVKDIEKSKYE